MDPLTLILMALASGVTAATQEVDSEAVKDAYHGLRALLQSKFAGQPEAELVLAKHEEKPKVWEAPLKEALVEVAADQDEEIIRAAQKLMGQLNPQQAVAGKYNVQITGKVQGFVLGDNAQVEMNFGNEPEEE